MLELTTETLYILSGPQGSGKSTLVSNIRYQDPATGELKPLPQGMVLSSDALRATLFGTTRKVIDGVSAAEPRDLDDDLIFATLTRAVEHRMKQRLTTFIDAMSLTESERNAFARYAVANNMAVQVLMFDLSLEQTLAQNANRETRVLATRVGEAYKSFVRESAFSVQRVTPEDVLQVQVLKERRTLPEDVGIDVIGDTHGLLSPLMDLLTKLGYDLVEGIPVHPQGRKLLFLGDMVDRGPDSIALLDLVCKAVQQGGHYALRGNHEQKLLLFTEVQAKGRLTEWSSIASATTGLELLRQPPERKAALMNFLRSLPGYYVRGSVAFVHADIGREFVPGNMTLEECIYGVKSPNETVDSDALARAANSVYAIVRGHVLETSPGLGTVTVYDDAEYGGNLVSLRLPAAAVTSHAELAEYATQMVKVPTNFDYDAVAAKRSPLKRDLDRLVKEKLVTREVDTRYGFTLYKYSKSVFYDYRWNDHAALLRARGIVFDITGSIVQNPFTKVFNYLENGTTYPEDKLVVAPVKMNGYLISVCYHPAEEDKLLVTTTGMFDSPFVRLAESFIKQQKAFGPLLRTLRNRQGLTLQFELVHPEDPHIVQYTQEEYGLYLIGARHTQEDALEWTEQALDELAAEIGPSVRRVTWEVLPFGDLLKKANAAKNLEGWMFRANDTEQRILGKLKTPWYLTTKFLARMNDGNVKFLFKNPQEFKRKLDEEFFTLVDQLVVHTTAEQYLALDESQRINLVASLL